MSSQGFLLIDLNHIGYASQAAHKELRSGDNPTGAIFGTLRSIRMAIGHFPTLVPIALHDGVTWRKTACPEYKANRDKPEATTSYEIEGQKIRADYKAQKKFINRGLKALGVRQMIADNLEADDLAGILVPRYAATKKIMMLSGDKDWIQLVRPNVGWLCPVTDRRITAKTLSEKLGYEKVTKDRKTGEEISRSWRGVPSARAWLEIKALMGDVSDNLAGVGGIGEKGAIEFMHAFGSVAGFLNRTIDGSLPKLPKKLEAFGTDPEKQALYRRNMALMDLTDPNRPAPVNMRVIHQPCDPEAFKAFCVEHALGTFLKDIDGWIAPFNNTQH